MIPLLPDFWVAISAAAFGLGYYKGRAKKKR